MPRWAYVPRMWSRLNSVLSLGSALRIVSATAIVSVVMIGGLKWAVPQMMLPNLLPLFLAFPAFVLMLVAQFGLLTLIRPIATIRSDKILIQHGQTATIIDTKSVTAARLTFFRDERIRLRIDYTRKSKPMSRVVGVPPDVDFDRLSEMLPVTPVIKDARDRQITRPVVQDDFE